MTDIIQLLPDSVANQIAAGEVIQRPASVVKELVENAVDAGAKTIHVLVVDAGRTSIQVIDDGKGMSDTDARLSFERHATSKIRKANDLFALRTMGFRGEALASIAAVAQIELKTRRETDVLGTHLSMEASRCVGQEPCSCAVGSNFLVKNLFFNVPARRRFLKSNTTELNNIVSAFERIALVYPQITFTLHNNEMEMHHLKACGLRQRIIDVFGKRLNQNLLPINVDTTLCKISGFVGKPESSKKKGSQQYFFVNDRYMKHPYFNKAVQMAYERMVPDGEQVPYFIYFNVDPAEIDVNIHPTKTEIKFENEQSIWQMLSAAVKESIGMFSEVPTIDFDTEGRPDIPVFNNDASSVSVPKVSINPSYNPFQHSAQRGVEQSVDQWEQLYGGMSENEQPDTADLFGASSTSSQEEYMNEKSPAHYQYKGKYIMTAVKSGLMIIEQHRAHVRILYDKYILQLRKKVGSSQKVLFPEVIQFSPAERVLLPKVMETMETLGFELNDMGNGNYSINAVPAGVEGVNVMNLIHEMLTNAKELNKVVGDDFYHSIALTLAKNAAIPQGQILNNQEMENIVNTLFAGENVNYTPDGKAILCILRQEEIEKLLEN